MTDCLLCDSTSVTRYKIQRGAVSRNLHLCKEHGKGLETLIHATTKRKKAAAAELVDVKDLKPSRAILARQRKT